MTTFITDPLRAQFEELLTRYPQKRAALIPILHAVQDDHGYLPDEALEEIAAFLDLEPVEVLGVVTFYPMFSRTPRGEHQVVVCQNIACHVRGAEEMIEAIEKRLGIAAGQVTPDEKIGLTRAECLGACGYGPMMSVDGSYHENLTPKLAVEIVEGLS